MSALRAGRCINGSRRNRVEDRLFITVWYRVSATLTSRMKGCRAASRELTAAGVRVAGCGTMEERRGEEEREGWG